MPDIQIDMMTVGIAVVANFILGFVWYTLLFRRSWALEMGFDPDEKPEMSGMYRGMALNVLGNFLLAWVFAHNIAVWSPETWGLAPSGISALTHAAAAAFFTWLGFFVPMMLTAVAWEKHSWKLFGINASYHLLALLIVAVILTHL